MDTLPHFFLSLAGKVEYVKKVSENEYHSTCPQCGSEGHDFSSGDPDRFVMWIVGRRGTPFGMCRRCRYKWSPSKQDANWTKEEREEFKRKIVEMEREYEIRLAEKLTELSWKIQQDGIYLRYHEDGMRNNDVIKYWEEVRGIPVEWQKHLKKGYCGYYTVKNHLTQYQRPAYMNPVWTEGGIIENVKVRVVDPLDKNDRFRNLYKSGCQHLYKSQYNAAPTNKAVILEGENKCDMVTIHGNLPAEYTIYGVQSKQPEKRILRKLDKFEVVYLALDPDAYEATRYYDQKTGEEKIAPAAVMDVAKTIGIKRVRFVVPPKGIKFDDAISQGFKFVNAVNMAVKII